MRASPRMHGGATTARFFAVGIGAALLFFLLTWLLSIAGLPPLAAGILAYAMTFAAAYTAQRDWTFGGAHDHRRALPRYLAAQLGCAGASGLVGHVCVEVLGASPFWMSVAVTATAGAASYLLSSFWVFAGAGAR